MPPGPGYPTEEELAATGRVYRLLDTPEPDRDDAWREAFLADLPLALFAFEPSFRGPDGFPYRIFRRVPSGATQFSGGSIRHGATEIMDALEGVVIEPSADRQGAAWVLSYGDLACDRMFGSFTPPLGWTSSRPDLPVAETLVEAEVARVGVPNLEYLPEFVRVGLGAYLRAMGVPRPRVLLALRPNGDRALAFNLTGRDLPDERRREAVRGLLFWYLPKGYLVLGALAEDADRDGADLLPPIALA